MILSYYKIQNKGEIMDTTRKISDDIYYVGCSNRTLSLFENIYPIPNGMCYNSYLLMDDKTILFDSCDKTCAEEYFSNITNVLNGKNIDYLMITHVEPDHGAFVKDLIEMYPNMKIICSQKAKQLLFQFFEFETNIDDKFNIIKEGDSFATKNHEFTFISAPMVHWPEVTVIYDKKSKILFSADAFGSFGAMEGNIFDDETSFNQRIDEYRRYYTNIVGKYGQQTKMLLSKAQNLDIKMICPLHGLIIKENIRKIIDLYLKWATYTPEEKSVLIVYGTVHGGTKRVSEIIANKLSQKGIKNIKIFDVSQTHFSYIISDIFKYSHIVLASITYNNGIFSNMENLINNIVHHNIQNRTWAFVENGSWAPNSWNLMRCEIEKIKNFTLIDEKLTINSTLKSSQETETDNFVKAITDNMNI